MDKTADSLIQTAASVAGQVLSAHADDVDAAGRFPHEGLDALREGGLMGLVVPTGHGGAGQGMRTFAAVTEELAQGCASTAMIYVMHVTATQPILASSTFDDKDEVLRAIGQGRHLTTLAFSEAGSRSHFWAPMSQLQAHNGHFVTSGRKSWVTAASVADSYVASARSAGASSPLDSILYLTRRGDTVRVGGRFNGLGLRGNDSAPVVLDETIVEARDFLTPAGEGAKAIVEIVLPWFSVGTAAMAHGLCRAAVTATSQHLQAAGFEHTGEKLRDLPVLRARLADMSVRTEQSRALLARTLDALDRPDEMTLRRAWYDARSGSLGLARWQTPLLVLQSRLSALEAAVDVTDLAMKTCGGAAFSRHLGIERLFRDARAGWVMAPTADHLKDFIGKALTGQPYF
jgi:alkylation response protein AidB-like acyl-CoA dehydrogenase